MNPLVDVVFLRAWYSILPRKFYNPVTSLLLSDKGRWTGMRLTGQVRRDEGLKTPLNANSTYKPVERAPRRFNTLKVPKKLQAALPYASKPKIMKPQHRQTYLEKRAVVMEPEEKKSQLVKATFGLLTDIWAAKSRWIPSEDNLIPDPTIRVLALHQLRPDGRWNSANHGTQLLAQFEYTIVRSSLLVFLYKRSVR